MLECVTIQMKATEKYFHVVQCTIHYFVVVVVALTLTSVDKTLVRDYSNESCWGVLWCGKSGDYAF